MSKNPFPIAPIINNMNDAIALLMRTIPNGCYAEILGNWVWVEQIANDNFAIFSIPKDSRLHEIDITEWPNIDSEQSRFNCLSIESWMEKPVFGLLSSIVCFDDYARKCFVVSNKGNHPLQNSEEWKKWVMQMYICVRKNDCSIPDEALEAMRDILLTFDE